VENQKKSNSPPPLQFLFPEFRQFQGLLTGTPRIRARLANASAQRRRFIATGCAEMVTKPPPLRSAYDSTLHPVRRRAGLILVRVPEFALVARRLTGFRLQIMRSRA
jgi:hypothetical protein